MVNKKLKKSLYALLGMGILSMNLSTQIEATEVNSVENKADFSTDTIYQVITDRFSDGNIQNNPTGAIFDKSNPRKYHGGDWQGIINRINDGYLTNMGVSAIWISSPVENITTLDPTNGSASYHGYWARDFFKTNQAFGTVDDFKNLVSVAHKNGIKIVIDFAPNHTSTAEFKGMTFPEDGKLYRNGQLVSSFSQDDKNIFNHESWTDYSTYENGIYHSMYGLADLNQLNPEVDQYLKDAIDTWVDFDIDGIRVDAVKHMPFGWQKNWLSHIYEKTGIFIFGEWFSGGTGNEADMTKFANDSGMSLLDFRFANAVRNLFSNTNFGMNEFYNVIKATEKDYQEVADQVTFIDNHDMSRFADVVNSNQDDINQAYTLLLTSRGVPTIYYGSEQYQRGVSDPDNRGDMTDFNQNSDAYKVIGSLSKLRKNNLALAYGTTEQKWINNDVIIYERKFGSNVVLTAVNKGSQNYHISGLYTSLPSGSYDSVLSFLTRNTKINVDGQGKAADFWLKANEVNVWEFQSHDNEVEIGDVDPSIGITGNVLTISGTGFGNQVGQVLFDDKSAEIIEWNDEVIKLKVAQTTPGLHDVIVKTNAGKTVVYPNFEVLTDSQIPYRIFGENIKTTWNENVYVVGNVEELGNWDVNKAVGPMFNATQSIAQYPNWFIDLNLPTNRAIEYKLIKKDSSGKVIWESGSNHKIHTSNTADSNRSSWQY